MTEALENACEQIVNVLRNVDGLQQVPLNPPSMMSYSTFAVIYPYTGNLESAPIGNKQGLHSIAIDVLTKDTDLARAVERVKPLVDLVSMALIREASYDSDGNPGGLFNHSMNTFGRLTYSWIPLTDYGGVPVLGYHFLMEDVKIWVNL